MKFFVPQSKRGQSEPSYQNLFDLLKDQLRMPLTPRRIFSIDYTHDKKQWHAEVGKLEQQERRYEILAIFESAGVYIIVTQAKNGNPGVKILVSKDEVTDVKDFD
jgi:hypothetical protein